MKKVEQFLKNTKREYMSSEEKAEIRGSLSAFMDSHPVRPRGILSPYTPHVSPLSPFIKSWRRVAVRSFQARYVHAFLVILLAAGGTLSAAAESALPGDTLYGMKVNFNEKMSVAFALSPEAKGLREADLASRRLKEAAHLSAQGKLTPEARGVIEAKLENHVENIEKQVKELSSSDNLRSAVEVNSALESALAVHETVMLDLSESSDEAGKVASTIHDELAEVSKNLTRLEGRFDNEVSIESETEAQKKAAEAEKQMNIANAEIEKAREEVELEAIDRSERYMIRSIRYFDEGKSKIEDGLYNQAFILFQNSIQYSKKAVFTIEASRELKKNPVSGGQDKNQNSHENEGGQATTTDPLSTSTPPVSGEGSASTTATTTVGAIPISTSLEGAIELDL